MPPGSGNLLQVYVVSLLDIILAMSGIDNLYIDWISDGGLDFIKTIPFRVGGASIFIA